MTTDTTQLAVDGVQELANDFGLKFSSDDLLVAHKEWKLNCGPSALAAACGVTPSEVRPHLGEFERRGYMSPTMMSAALDSLGMPWHEPSRSRKVPRDLAPCVFPKNGLVRVQWCGPWTASGANGRWAYGQTHWIAVRTNEAFGTLVFDVNSGPVTYQDWDMRVAPAIVKSIKRADGEWYFTHLWEIEQRFQTVLGRTCVLVDC